jgi:chromosome segregation ATPase
MATARRNIKEVLTTEGQKLNNTAAKEQNSDNSDASDEQDLAATVAELKSALAAANKREDTLQKQITSLQTDMGEQKVHVEKLEKLELKSELDEAKQTALKLAEKNSELQAEIKALKAENQALKNRSRSIYDRPVGYADRPPASKQNTENQALKNRDRSIYERPIGYADHRPAGKQNTETGDRNPQSNLKMWLD